MYNLLIYIIVLITVIWAMDGVNLNSIFKQNHVYQARVFYMLSVIVISYIVVSFINDFLGVFN